MESFTDILLTGAFTAPGVYTWSLGRWLPSIPALFNSGVWAICAIFSMLKGNLPFMAGAGVVCALWAYTAWKNKPPRKKRESKTLAKIRDLGHRLVTE